MSHVILDTGPLVAFLDRGEAHNAWATAWFAKLEPPLLTCEAVLAEAMFLLKRMGKPPELPLQMVERGMIKSVYSVQQEAKVLVKLIQRYRNVPMTLADGCLVRMAEIHEGARVMTMDSDFTVYRKSGRHVIPVIMPG